MNINKLLQFLTWVILLGVVMTNIEITEGIGMEIIISFSVAKIILVLLLIGLMEFFCKLDKKHEERLMNSKIEELKNE